MSRLDLWDYRRRVAALYDRVRSMGLGPRSHEIWVAERDELLATHPQSPIPVGEPFDGLPYYPYAPEMSVVADLASEDDTKWGDFVRIGRLEFSIHDIDCALPVYWLDAYGGGVFVPFKDGTSGATTYGGGRYILDTVKGADLGHTGNRVMLDFNFSYHPSCVHSSRWTCPLAPPGSVLDFAVEAGEMLRSR